MDDAMKRLRWCSGSLWMAGLAALALLFFCHPAHAMNPDGAGQVAVDGLGAWGRPIAGDRAPANGQYSYDQLKSALTWGLRATMPLDDAWSLVLAGVDDQWSAVDGASAPGTAFDEQVDYQSSGMALGARFYTHRLAGRAWAADQDPDAGVALWPVLTLVAGWTQASSHWSVLDDSGYALSQPKDLSEQALDLSLAVDWPLSRQWAVELLYDQQAYSTQSQGGQSRTLGGGPAVLLSGLDFAFDWRRIDPDQAAFPGLGRPGRLHLRAEQQVSWADGIGATQLSQGGAISAALPLTPRLALRLGFQAQDAGGAYASAGEGLPMTQHRLISQRVFGSLVISLGSAGQP